MRSFARWWVCDIFFQNRIYTTSFKILFAFAFPSQCQLCGLSKRKHTVAFFKGRGSPRYQSTYIRSVPYLYCNWPLSYITGHWKLIIVFHISSTKHYSSSSGFTAYLWCKKFRKICGLTREQWTISRPILKKMIDFFFFFYIFTYFYMHIFT